MFGVFDIALGWAWHTSYRARRFWRLRREGALIAAVVVAIVGIVDVMNRPAARSASIVTPRVASAMVEPARPAVTAATTPITAQTQAVASISPSELKIAAPQTISASGSDSVDESGFPSLGAKRYNEPISTGSIARPAALKKATHQPKVKPAAP